MCIPDPKLQNPCSTHLRCAPSGKSRKCARYHSPVSHTVRIVHDSEPIRPRRDFFGEVSPSSGSKHIFRGRDPEFGVETSFSVTGPRIRSRKISEDSRNRSRNPDSGSGHLTRTGGAVFLISTPNAKSKVPCLLFNRVGSTKTRRNF